MVVYEWIDNHLCPAHIVTVVSDRMFKKCIDAGLRSFMWNSEMLLTNQLQPVSITQNTVMILREELSND